MHSNIVYSETYFRFIVTSLGGVPVFLDAWGVDAAYSCTQKCLSCPPGLGPLTFSDRAMKKIAERKTRVANWCK
jgi:alanine-glyoxylate transaminase/serine-glyoxylate transaminase/serine-pyruvate transaminase